MLLNQPELWMYVCLCVCFVVRKKKPNGSWHSFEMKNFDWTAQSQCYLTHFKFNGIDMGSRGRGMVEQYSTTRNPTKSESERKIWKTLIRNTKMCLRSHRHRQFSCPPLSLSLSLRTPELSFSIFPFSFSSCCYHSSHYCHCIMSKLSTIDPISTASNTI